MLKTYAAVPLTALLLLAGTACGDAEGIVSGAARSAACKAAEQAVTPVKAGARSAVAELGVDPAGARTELTALKGAVDAAAATVSGEIRESLKKVSGELGVLIDEARAAAQGAVDRQAVDQARDDLGTAVDDLTEIC